MTAALPANSVADAQARSTQPQATSVLDPRTSPQREIQAVQSPFRDYRDAFSFIVFWLGHFISMFYFKLTCLGKTPEEIAAIFRNSVITPEITTILTAPQDQTEATERRTFALAYDLTYLTYSSISELDLALVIVQDNAKRQKLLQVIETALTITHVTLQLSALHLLSRKILALPGFQPVSVASASHPQPVVDTSSATSGHTAGTARAGSDTATAATTAAPAGNKPLLEQISDAALANAKTLPPPTIRFAEAGKPDATLLTETEAQEIATGLGELVSSESYKTALLKFEQLSAWKQLSVIDLLSAKKLSKKVLETLCDSILKLPAEERISIRAYMVHYLVNAKTLCGTKYSRVVNELKKVARARA